MDPACKNGKCPNALVLCHTLNVGSHHAVSYTCIAQKRRYTRILSCDIALSDIPQCLIWRLPLCGYGLDGGAVGRWPWQAHGEIVFRTNRRRTIVRPPRRLPVGRRRVGHTANKHSPRGAVPQLHCHPDVGRRAFQAFDRRGTGLWDRYGRPCSSVVPDHGCPGADTHQATGSPRAAEQGLAHAGAGSRPDRSANDCGGIRNGRSLPMSCSPRSTTW